MLVPSDAVTLNMAELGEATVNRILYEKSVSEEEHLKELVNSRSNEEIVNHLKNCTRARESFQVLGKNHREDIHINRYHSYRLTITVCCSSIDLQQ